MGTKSDGDDLRWCFVPKALRDRDSWTSIMGSVLNSESQMSSQFCADIQQATIIINFGAALLCLVANQAQRCL